MTNEHLKCSFVIEAENWLLRHPPSILNGLHINLDGHGLAASAEADTFHWSDIAVVAAPGQSDVTDQNSKRIQVLTRTKFSLISLRPGYESNSHHSDK